MKNVTSLLLLFFLANSWHLDAQELISGDLIHDDSLRTYKLYVPADYTGDEPWPLVMVLHGFGLDADFMIAMTGMNAVADTGHFLVAYPQGLLVNNPSATPPFPPIAPGWNIGNLFTSGNDDVGFVSKLIDKVSLSYNIEPAKVYACGLSNGGMMVNKLACELSGRIAAIANVAGSSAEMVACDPGRPVPMLILHGTSDPIAPFDGDPGFLQPVLNTISFWVGNNNCDAEPSETMLPDIVTSDSSTVTLKTYGNCDAEAEVLLYQVENGGHTWPGQLIPPPPFVGVLNEDFNATVEIWNFFNRHEHPNPAGQVIDAQFIHNDSLRTYKLYVPADYTGDEPWPLVMVLHGYTLNSDFMIALTGMNAVADTGHFLVAYPQGLLVNNPSAPPPFPTIAPGWNLGNLFTSGNDDVSFVSKLISEIGLSYKIDIKRVYACGLSNGGSMMYRLACELSDRIAAFASVSGGMAEDVPCFPDRPVPFMEIHGTADSINLYDGIPGLLTPIPEGIDFWVNNNQCDEVPTVMDFPDLDPTDSTTVSLKKYGNCDEGANVWLMDVVDGGHVWPTSFIPPPPFIGPTNNDVHGGSEIWNFLQQHEHPDPLEAQEPEFADPVLNPFKVYPNPASSDLNIHLESKNLLTEGTVSIFSLVGTKIIEKEVNPNGTSIDLSIDIGHLPNGVYIVQFKSGAYQLSGKFLKVIP
jgi:polyhydroxybutyrate depolymerase